MSEQRLSKLQKWILKNCFKVTILSDRTALKELKNANRSRQCRDCPKTNESVRVERENRGFVTPRCVIYGSECPYFLFYKDDILLSFFLLPPNNSVAHFARVQHFQESPDYAKAHVTTHRSITNLVDKGLIYTFSAFREESLQIHLTDKGVEKAAELLGISDYASLIGG
jgi:hypothetical protein